MRTILLLLLSFPFLAWSAPPDPYVRNAFDTNSSTVVSNIVKSLGTNVVSQNNALSATKSTYVANIATNQIPLSGVTNANHLTNWAGLATNNLNANNLAAGTVAAARLPDLSATYELHVATLTNKIYGSNVVSGGQLPVGLLATNTAASAGNEFLQITGDSRKWVSNATLGGTLTVQGSIAGVNQTNSGNIQSATLNTTGVINAGGGFKTTSTLEVGASGYIQIGNAGSERFYFQAPSSGVVTFYDGAGTSFNRVQFGGTTAAFPSLKRNGGNLEVSDGPGTGTTNGLTVPGTLTTANQTNSGNIQSATLNTTGTLKSAGNFTATSTTTDGNSIGGVIVGTTSNVRVNGTSVSARGVANGNSTATGFGDQTSVGSVYFYKNLAVAATIDNNTNFTIVTQFHATNGVASYGSNQLAVTSITVGASPFNWTNTTTKNVFVFTYGGEISDFKINGSTVGDNENNVPNPAPLQPGEWATVTYNIAPTMKWKPF